MELTGQAAMVTGAGSGVGRVVAQALAEQGFRVALVGRREEKLWETQSGVSPGAALTRTYVADVTRPEQMEPVLDDIRQRWGEVLVLVNNAGVHGEFTPITQSDPLRWRDTLLTNLFAPYLLCRLCVPAMIEQGWGRIINVSSASGLSQPQSLNSAYALTKYALNYLTRQLAEELNGTEISCTAIHPGEVRTEMWEAIKSDSAARGPMAQGARDWSDLVERTGGDPPEKAVELVLKILESDAATVNGQFLWIQGGLQAPRHTW